MTEKPIVNIFWFRRDLRLHDNAGLYYALRSEHPVLPLFIFDKNILDKIPEKDDARVTFISHTLLELDKSLKDLNSSLLVKYATPKDAFVELLNHYMIKEVYTNTDYEPYAKTRDLEIAALLKARGVILRSYKDHLIFEKDEVVKDDGKPYTVYTAYKRKWLEKLRPDSHLTPYITLTHSNNFFKGIFNNPYSLADLGFSESKILIPDKVYKPVLATYAETRDFPAINGTSRIGIHLRFGTISIREIASDALDSPVWLSELIWRDFYSMILWNFPETAYRSFKKEYDNIKWRNNEDEFIAWCQGRTGYPIVDAGMRQLNETGWMHNRVRMIVASFLCKHLLIDWRWGEAYFAQKLIDYDMASNVGGWQWAAGTGNDAAPYFRIFNPDLQTKKFDSKMEYIKRWIPEYSDPFTYPAPIVDHKYARERALSAYSVAVKGNAPTP